MNAAQVARGTFNRQQLFAVIVAERIVPRLGVHNLVDFGINLVGGAQCSHQRGLKIGIDFPQFVGCRRVLELNQFKVRKPLPIFRSVVEFRQLAVQLRECQPQPAGEVI